MTLAVKLIHYRTVKAGAVLLLSLFVLWACARAPAVVSLTGETMGTSWHVTVVGSPLGVQDLQLQIEHELEKVDKLMSTYRPDSEISRFNQAESGPVPVSAETLAVTAAALDVARQTNGAFNPAVASLVNLWGFGPETASLAPSADDIMRALTEADLSRLQLDKRASTLAKTATIALDFSAIAKGYGVDRVALALEHAGSDNYLVEVGGEVRTRGVNGKGLPWRIGIEAPALERGGVAAAIEVSGLAVATSGDYRNYRELNGERISHTIDPYTGYPVRHKLASVTVVAESAMLADAYATALTVMGPELALDFANSRGLAAYLIVKVEGGFESRSSQAFAPFLR